MTRRKKMIKHFKRTWKTKLAALALMGVGYWSIGIDNDATAFVFLMFLAVPLFFARDAID